MAMGKTFLLTGILAVTGAIRTIPLTAEDRRNEAGLSFLPQPGLHTVRSPVVGSRTSEYALVKGLVDSNCTFNFFEDAIYQMDHIYLIPVSKRDQADILAKEIFLGYIRKYEQFGIMPENIVYWARPGKPAPGVTYFNEVGTWSLYSLVEDRSAVKGGLCFPKHIAAYHEVMHVEETPPGAPESFQDIRPKELVPTLRTIMLLDEIYKKLHGIALNVEQDYGKVVRWGERSARLGSLANLYRALENKYGTLEKAVISRESIEFVGETPKAVCERLARSERMDPLPPRRHRIGRETLDRENKQERIEELLLRKGIKLRN